MASASLIFIGICGTVVALDRSSGEEVWRCSLKGADFVNVVLEGGDLYATTKGELFCLDPVTGKIRWQNPLKGLGRGLITIAANGSQQTVVMGEKHRQDEEDAAAARRRAMNVGLGRPATHIMRGGQLDGAGRDLLTRNYGRGAAVIQPSSASIRMDTSSSSV